MKKEHPRLKKAAINGGLFLALFGVAGTTTYFAIPKEQAGVFVDEGEGEEEYHGGSPVQTGVAKFITNLTNAASDGLNITFDTLRLSFPGGEEIDPKNTIDASGAKVAFAMEELSIHGIELGVHLPINYDGHHHQVDVSLYDESLYLDLLRYTSGENDELTEDVDNWSFKYKVSLDEFVSTVVDPTTGGYLQYEYGDLDWLIHDVIAILTDGGINVPSLSLDTIMGLINGSDDSEEEEEGEATEEETTDILTLITSSLAEMAPVGDDYYVWTLPLNGTDIKIGFRHDADQNLTGVDLPARESSTADLESLTFEKDGKSLLDLSVSATVDTGASAIQWADFIPSNPADYLDLCNSADLFEKVARYVANPEFGLRTYHGEGQEDGLLLTHYASAAVSSGETLTSEDVIEEATLSLSGDVAIHDGLSRLDATLGFATGDFHTSVAIGYAPSNEDTTSMNGYLNLNNVLKARVSKVTMDEVVTKVKDALPSSSETEEQTSAISSLIEKIMGLINLPEGLQNILDGRYAGVLDFIKSIQARDNQIKIVLTLSPLNIDGTITLLVDGTYSSYDSSDSGKVTNAENDGSDNVVRLEGVDTDTYLTAISFDKVMLSSFCLDGSIALDKYNPAEWNDAEFQELHHIPSLIDQIEDIADSKEAKVTFTADYVKSEKGEGELTQAVYDEGTPAQKVGFKAQVELGMDFASKEIGLTGKVNQISKAYSQDHHFSLAVTPTEKEVDGETVTSFGSAYISYDSQNDAALDENGKDGFGKSRTNPHNDALMASIDFSSFEGLIENVKSLVPSLDEIDSDTISSFKDTVTKVGKIAGFSLADDLSDTKVFSLLKDNVLVSADLSSPATLVLNGELFGAEINPVITINWADTTDEEGETVYGGLSSIALGLNAGTEYASSFALSLDATSGLSSADLNPFASFDPEAFTSFNTLPSMLEYALDGKDLGVTSSNATRVYDLAASVNLTLGEYTMTPFTVAIRIAYESGNVRAHVSAHNIPVIKGVNAPDDELYFRSMEAEGYRNVDLYFHMAELDEDLGEIYITRESSYGRITGVKDAMLLTGKQFFGKTDEALGRSFSNNAIGYLLNYMLGVNDSFLEAKEESETTDASSSSSLFSSRALHFEDILANYTYNGDEGNLGASPSWSMGVDLGNLLGAEAILGNADLTIYGAKVKADADGDFLWKTLSGLKVELGMELGGELKVCSASIEAKLVNLDTVYDESLHAFHVYRDSWNVENNPYFVNYRLADGTSRIGEEGAFDAFVTYTGENATPMNHYLGI